ncbi:MAG TPA: DUF547 domain-containing protein [Burkholderiales bacterium]|nr:DUF547 domain-containing protein [Burkholderiales bacterium]
MKKFLLAIFLLLPGLAQAAFDQTHAQWDALTHRHVVPTSYGYASQVDYKGFQADRAALKAYLDGLSAVTPAEYEGWTRPQKLAFLINAYNAFTVELVLTAYPELKSIKDLGSFLRSPWKKTFFSLLGKEHSLDDIEQEMIRAPGAFDDARIHMALNKASAGSPALRKEAFVADKLDAQLEDGVQRFLSDRSRNRFDAQTRKLEVSKLFDWSAKDFAARAGSVEAWLAKYSDRLGDNLGQRQAIRNKQAKVEYLDYDWSLNDRR